MPYKKDTPVDSFILSEYAIGFDGLAHFYDDTEHIDCEMTNAFLNHSNCLKNYQHPI